MSAVLSESISRRLLASLSEEHSQMKTGNILIIVFCLMLCALLLGYCYHQYAIFRKIERFFPISSANLILGFVIGLIINMFGGLGSVFSFNPQFFFIYILPPIIFCAGYNVPKDFFFHNFGSIMIFAFVGTTISALFIGSCLYGFGQINLITKMSFIKNMMLGSLISAVDPVSIILVLKVLNVDEQLKVLLFGESVLNDAAAVVINRVFVSIEDNEKSQLEALAPAFPLVIGVAIASMLIGTLVGLLLAFLFKHLHLNKTPEIELAFFFIGSFMPYGIAQALNLSGIMAVLFCGIMTDYYTVHHLSPRSLICTQQTIQTLSYLAETFVFIYLGMSFFLDEGHEFKFGYIAVTLFLCFVARALSIFPLSFLLNLGRKHKLPFKHQLILWFSGLRGPVAYALAVATPSDDTFPLANNIIITTTLVIVFITTLILGGFAYPFLQWIQPPIMRSTNMTKTDTYDISNHWFSRLDRRWLRPWFGSKSRPIKLNGIGTSLVEKEIEMQVHHTHGVNHNNSGNTLQLITEEDLHSRGIIHSKKHDSLRSPSRSQTSFSNSQQSSNTLELRKYGGKNKNTGIIIDNEENEDNDANNDNIGILRKVQKESLEDVVDAEDDRNSSTQRTRTQTQSTAAKYYVKQHSHPMLIQDADITATMTTMTTNGTQSNTHLNVLLSGMKSNVDYSLPRSRPPSFIDHPQEMSRSHTWSNTLLDVHPTSQSKKSVTPPPITGISGDGDDDLDLMTNITGNQGNIIGSVSSIVGRKSSSLYETPTPI